jgi:hypothetical protein
MAVYSLDEAINLGRAAELLNLHRLELQEQFLAQGIPLRLGVETIEEAQAEMAAISHWNTAAESRSRAVELSKEDSQWLT